VRAFPTWQFHTNITEYVDQYHLGFTMRFPRAVSIRDDLSIADCMTATGKCVNSTACDCQLHDMPSEILQDMTTMKKRKVEEETE
jgi:DNA ligase 4